MKLSAKFAWYDLWIGLYWDRKARVLHCCPLPTVLLSLSFGPCARARILSVLSTYAGPWGVPGMAVREAAEVSAGRFYSLVLEMEEQGLVTRIVGVPEARRGGRPNHFFAITDAGRERLWELTGESALRRSK